MIGNFILEEWVVRYITQREDEERAEKEHNIVASCLTKGKKKERNC